MGRHVDIAKAMWSAVRATPPSFPDNEGWQAFAAGNLDRAEAVAQELLGRAAAPNVLSRAAAIPIRPNKRCKHFP